MGRRCCFPAYRRTEMHMNEAEIIKTLNQVFADAVADVKAGKRFLSGMRSTLLGKGYVIQQAEGYQWVKGFVDGGVETTMAPWRAARWSKEAATHNATCVLDGAGKPYVAIHVVDATEAYVERSLRTLKALRESEYGHHLNGLTDDVNWVGHPTHY